MLSKVIVLSALVAVVYSAAVDVVPVVAQNSDIFPDGKYQYNYESGDGSKQEQHGVPKPVDKDNVIEAVEGSVSYTDPDGGHHDLTYVADENGYQPQGDDVPKIPEAIARALQYIAEHPEHMEMEKH
ncbi:unnamed protein product [Ceutorhynchus assimilis]|uniref:Larval cuticle protein LCP-17-like n=1 Tax=Ceutorhynchus assimilis TaxID=467358 RepID=A0A9N9QQU9_9CUCU|nr:unnamed protein product [Ceutorhynchus assimilis]